MKNLVLFIITLSIIVCSCGGGSDNKKDSKKANPSDVEVVLDTQEVMMEKLEEIKVSIPEEMIYQNIQKSPYLNKNYDECMSHVIHFKIDNADEATKNKMYEWHDNQYSKLIADGWTEKSYRKDKEIVSGGVYSTYELIKENIDCRISISISYNSENACAVSIGPRFGL